MNLTVLVDNNTLIDRYFKGEPGLSFFVEAEGNQILFDTGYSDLFISNAQKMGIDLLNLDYVILSHSHLDHTWGLPHLITRYTEAVIEEDGYQTPTLVTHPDTFASRSMGEINQIGSIISREEAALHFDLNLSTKPVWLTDNLVFLGEITRNNDFEAQSPIGKVVKDGVKKDDYIIEDSALAYKSPEGLTIITGCSHAGICNIIDKAIEVCNEERVLDIIGGLHLQDPSEKRLEGTLDYMEELDPRGVYACHCVDLQSKIALAGVVDVPEVGVGFQKS